MHRLDSSDTSPPDMSMGEAEADRHAPPTAGKVYASWLSGVGRMVSSRTGSECKLFYKHMREATACHGDLDTTAGLTLGEMCSTIAASTEVRKRKRPTAKKAGGDAPPPPTAEAAPVAHVARRKPPKPK